MTTHLTDEQIIKAIPGTGGVKKEVARKLGVHRQTIRKRAKASPIIAEAIEEERQDVTDDAESCVVRKVREGDVKACIWWLGTIGKSRGFTTQTKTEHTGLETQSKVVIVRMPKNGREGPRVLKLDDSLDLVGDVSVQPYADAAEDEVLVVMGAVVQVIVDLALAAETELPADGDALGARRGDLDRGGVLAQRFASPRAAREHQSHQADTHLAHSLSAVSSHGQSSRF